MVKANGYGLGAVAVARALEPLDPWGFGVATVEEGAALRAAGIARPILVFSPLLPESIDAYLAHDLRPAIGDPVALRAWCARGDRPFHLEIDTGMAARGSAGTTCRRSRWPPRYCCAAQGLGRGLYPFSFRGHRSGLRRGAVAPIPGHAGERFPRRPALVHAANSAAALQGRCYAADLVRPGIFLYGGGAGGPPPRPVAALRTRVVAVRTLEAGDSVSYGATWRRRVDAPWQRWRSATPTAFSARRRGAGGRPSLAAGRAGRQRSSRWSGG